MSNFGVLVALLVTIIFTINSCEHPRPLTAADVWLAALFIMLFAYFAILSIGQHYWVKQIELHRPKPRRNTPVFEGIQGGKK